MSVSIPTRLYKLKLKTDKSNGRTVYIFVVTEANLRKFYRSIYNEEVREYAVLHRYFLKN